jgi:hypothetical protein
MKQEIIQRLHELSESITERHGWAVLKSHIEAIDEVIAAGVKTKAVEEALAELGLDLAPTSLRSALYRYRRKRKAQGFNEKPSSTVADPVPHRSSLSEAEKEFVSRLTPLEKIEFYRNRAQQRKGVEDPI